MKINDQKDCPVTKIDFVVVNPRHIPTTFQLGEGPCGRHVDYLGVEFNKKLLKITQGSTDSEHDGYEIKEFIYKIADIQGRIVVTK